MNTDEFQRLAVRLVESFILDPETAEMLLRRIIEILKKECGEEEENEVRQMQGIDP